MANYRIAVLGDRDSVLGFQALGLSVFPVQDGQEARTTLHRLAREDYGVIYLTEGLAAELERDIARYQDVPTPAVILIPGREGPQGIGLGNLKAAAERAVGVDIL